MTWLVLAFAFNLGFTPNDAVVQYQGPTWIVNQSAESIVNMDVELRAFDEHFYVGGSLGVPVWQAPNDGVIPSFWPNDLQSVVRLGFRWGGVEIGYSHLCTHPVMPYQPIVGSQTSWEGGYDEVHIKFSGSVKLF